MLAETEDAAIKKIIADQIKVTMGKISRVEFTGKREPACF